MKYLYQSKKHSFDFYKEILLVFAQRFREIIHKNHDNFFLLFVYQQHACTKKPLLHL